MAYAALISLKHTIERLINPTNPLNTKSAYKRLKFLGNIFRKLELQSLGNILRKLDGSSNSSIDRSAIYALDAEIREAVWKLEDVIESYALYGLDEKSVEQEIDPFLKTVRKLKEEYLGELDKPFPEEEEEEEEEDNVSPIGDIDGKKSRTVGLSDQFEKIRFDILDGKSGPKIVSLVGMAGIGKTHLARKIYQHPIIVRYFDFIAWVRVGPKRQKKHILVDIVAQVELKPRNFYTKKSLSDLKELLENSLKGRTYLIVLDDIWSTEVCDSLKWWLPPNKNGRRFLLTTRLEKVAEYHSTSIHQIPFLNNEESWNLLWQNVFADKSPPPQLENVGRKIAEHCEGLPLLILVVADILYGQEKTEEYWEKVAAKKTTTFTDAYDQILKVLYSSYEYLPQHLKACFLYMGVFPQSCEIRLTKLVNFWILEDFLEPNQSQTLEDFAMECLRELVSKSLAIVCKRSYNRKIKSCKLHSAYWHLCVTEARKIKFFHVLRKLADASKDIIESQRRLSIQNNILFGIKEAYDSMAATLTARSLLCTGENHEYQVPICLNLMLLKVLDALSLRFYEFPAEVVKLLQLRYLALTQYGKLPSSISKLQQLQFLIVRQHHNIKLLRYSTQLPKEMCDMQEQRSNNSTCLPKEIWDIQELRHLRIMGNNSLPNPSYGEKLPNLLTLYVNADSCTRGVFRGIPYLKKLCIKIELQPDALETLACFEHIGLLNELNALKCVIVNPGLRSQVVAPPNQLSNLPWGLKKLSLNGMGYSWEYISVIGSLRNLQVLKLRCNAFQGPEWEIEVREFQSVEFLLLEDIDLVHWTCSSKFCLPSLKCLIIRHCYKLKGIPSEIGVSRTLKRIEVTDCSPSAVASAQLRKSSTEVVIDSSWNL